MREFFSTGRSVPLGLALFLNAGDPPLPVLADLIRMLDEQRVDCLELAVPFPDSITDGPVIRRSADRALAAGVELGDVLDLVTLVRPDLRHLRIAVLADWSYTVRPAGIDEVVKNVAGAGADGLLLHGLPPRLRPAYYDVAATAGLPVVATCYATSPPVVRDEAADHASAYLYLVAAYGRSGRAPAGGYGQLAPVLSELRAKAHVPIAVGFGVSSRADLAELSRVGADAAVVGSAGVAHVEHAIAGGGDVVVEMEEFVHALQGSTDKSDRRSS